jgi:phytoene synthase
MTGLTDPDRQFALTHVPATQRAAMAALWSLDEVLGRIPGSTTQPMVGQMRLTWWYEALTVLTPGVVRGQPELDALAAHVVTATSGIVGADLARIVEGWEALLDPLPLPNESLREFAAGRAQAFALSARLLGATINDAPGAGWALADFGCRCSDPDTASRAFAMADEYLDQTDPKSLPRPLRILVRLARHDVIAGKRVARTPWKLLRSIA